jgi:poly(glycerol-phosphate) alpha-glucosyltransferase
MKIRVHVISPILSRFGGGVYTVVKELYGSRSFLSQKINLFLWSYKDNFCVEDCMAIEADKTFVSLKYPAINRFFYSPELKRKLLNQIETNDIIHLHSLWQYPSILLNQVNKDKKFKKIISTHGMLDPWALNNNKVRKMISLYFYEKKNLNTADCIHALCEQEYSDIRKLVPNVPIAIIPNGVYLPEIKVEQKSRNIRKQLLFLGRIHPKKGIENLIKAWAEIKENNWKLVIAGVDEKGHENYLKKIVSDLKLEENVEFVGPVFGTTKENLLMSSDAFILPSLSEGLPMSILEAWSYKLPVLMTPQCNLEIGYNVGAAIEIDTEVSGIKNGLVKMFNTSNEDLIHIGAQGYGLVKSEYTWDKVSSKMEELYLWVRGECKQPDFIKL